MKSRRSLFPFKVCLRLMAPVLCFFLFPGCATLSPTDETPGWFTNHQPHGSQHLYFPAKGESAQSLQQARQNALKSIQGEIARYIFSEVRVSESDRAFRISIESAVELREVETFAEHHAQAGRQWTVWILGRYPRAEYNIIRARLEAGVALDAKWREAQSAINRQQFTDGERLLTEIIDSYDKALRVPFELEAAKLELAALYLRQNRGLRARQWITDVQKTTSLPAWRSRADVLAGQVPPISLGDAFDGLAVGIYCGTRKDGVLSFDSDLAQVLNTRLAQHGIRTVLARQSALANTQVIDDEASKRVAEMLRAQSADVVFLLLLDVDSSKTGRKISIPGSDSQTDALDARLTYWIVRVSDGQILVSDTTPGFSHSLAGMLNTVLTHRRHLPSHAPAIAEGLGK